MQNRQAGVQGKPSGPHNVTIHFQAEGSVVLLVLKSTFRSRHIEIDTLTQLRQYLQKLLYYMTQNLGRKLISAFIL